MSDLDVAIDARIASYRPARIPPFEDLRKRRTGIVRKRFAGTLLLAAFAVASAAWVSGHLLAGDRQAPALGPAAGGPLVGGTAGLGAAPAVTAALRPLPESALLQISYQGGHGIPPQPEVPQIAVRVYQDGTILTSAGRTAADRWQQARLSAADLGRARQLAADAGLAAGDRDYGKPTNIDFAGARVVFQARSLTGPAVSAVDYGGTLNGVPSSDTSLTAEERAARAQLAALTELLGTAVQAGTTTYVPASWSRYAKRAIHVSAVKCWSHEASERVLTRLAMAGRAGPRRGSRASCACLVAGA